MKFGLLDHLQDDLNSQISQQVSIESVDISRNIVDIVTPRNLYRYKLRKIIMIGIFIGIRYENNNDN